MTETMTELQISMIEEEKIFFFKFQLAQSFPEIKPNKIWFRYSIFSLSFSIHYHYQPLTNHLTQMVSFFPIFDFRFCTRCMTVVCNGSITTIMPTIKCVITIF